MFLHNLIRDQKRLVLVFFLLCLALGFFLRADSLGHWLELPARYFFDDQRVPLLLGVDGYYYLDIARELLDGDYQPFDPHRQVPRGFERSATPPLLSVLTASLARVLPFSLEWIAIMLPPFFGALVGVPAFLLGRAFGSDLRLPWSTEHPAQASAANVMGLATALFTLLSPFLVSRSGIGWYETDPLNVFFATLMAFFAFAIGEAREPRRVLAFFAAWVAALLLFLWWWDQTEVPVFALSGVPLLVALWRISQRSPRVLLPMLGGLAGLAVVLVIWRGADVLDPGIYWRRLSSMYGYVTGADSSVFRATGAGVSEQSGTDLARFARDTAGGWLPFGAALVGLLGLTLAARQRALYLLALLLVTLMSFSGTRFLIFAAPLVGLGLGFLAFIIWTLRLQWWWRAGLLVVFLAVMAWLPLGQAQSYNKLVPRREPPLFDAMVKLRELTPPDAVIWASWGHGHPLVHYAERGTVGDGIYHPASLQYALAVPLAATNERLAANWIAFVVAHGVPGLQRANALFGDGPGDWAQGMPRLQQLLSLGVADAREALADGALDEEAIEQRLSFLFPSATRPIYLLIADLSLTESWSLLGRWDFTARGSKPGLFLPLEDLRKDGKGLVRGASQAGAVAIDLKRGKIAIGRRQAEFSRASILNQSNLQRVEYENESKYSLHLISKVGMGVFASENLSNALLTRLYFELDPDPAFFTPVQIRLPSYSIWKVKGESFATP